MKNFSALFPVASVFFAIPAVVFGEEISHAVSSATVYSDRAVVTRAGTARLRQGKNEIVFAGVRDNIDLRSIRAGAVPDGVKILGVSWERHISKTVANEEIARLENALRALRSSRAELSDQARTAKNRAGLAQKYLDLLFLSVSEQSASEKTAADAGDFEASSERLLSELASARENGDNLEARISDLDEKIASKEKELRRIYGNGDARREIDLIVSLDSSTEGVAEIPVSYTTYYARWIPQYDARVVEAARTADFSYNGLVAQNTGEDWRNVKLTFSTAQPQIGAFPPETRPVALSGRKLDGAPDIVEYEEAVAAEPRTENAAAGNFTADFSDYSEARAHGATVNFELAGTHNIAAGSRAHRVVIARKNFENVEFSVEAAPRLRDGVFLRAKIKNETPYPILDGEIDIYRGSGFIGKSALKYAPVNAELPFFAGTLDGLSVAVEKMVPRSRDGGIFSSAETVVVDGEIYTLSNITDTPRKVRVRSQIAVSEIDDVKIEMLDADEEGVPATTRGCVLDKETGLLYWDVVVPANGETRVVLSTRTTSKKK